MLQVFKKKSLNDEFLKAGFVSVDLIKPDNIKLLKSFYKENKIKSSTPFHTTHFSKNRDLKKKIHHYIVSQVWKELDEMLCDFKPIFANYMIKEAHNDSMMPLHADWTYVDESDDISIAAWVPLCDTNQFNGTLGVIPYSQHISNDIRGPRILQWEYPFNDILIEKAGKLINLKAGQAIIYNHRLLHYSPSNKSDDVRHAINISMVPNSKQVLHYTVPEGYKKIQCYKVDNEDFFLEYDNFQVPEKGNLEYELDIESSPILNEKLENFLSKYYTKGILNKLKKLIAIN